MPCIRRRQKSLYEFKFQIFRCGEINIDDQRLVSTYLGDLQAAEVLGQVCSMYANISHTAANTRFFRIKAPGCVFVVLIFLPVCEPVLRIFYYDLSHPVQSTRGNAFAGLFDQWIIGIGLRKTAEQPRLLDQLTQLQRFTQATGGGLVSDNVKSRAQSGLCLRKMQVVGCENGHKLHPLGNGQRCLRCQHRLVIGIDTLGWQVPRRNARRARHCC